MERVTAHYAERIQHNQVAREKEALRIWQVQKQSESQRIAEVIELCAKQPASTPPLSNPDGASSGPAVRVEPASSAAARAASSNAR